MCGVDPLQVDDVLDLLASLVDKSLVLLDEHEAVGRYRMLETIREYAREKLEEEAELTRFRTETLRALLCEGQAGPRRNGGFRAGRVDSAR